jgi:CheY-like chemotaxis protein
VDNPNESRPGREAAGPLPQANRTEPNSETARPTSVNGSPETGQTEMLQRNCGNQLRADRDRERAKLIAIIDDDEAMQDSLRDLMEAAGLVARCFGSAREFLESGLHHQAACLITDILMPKMSGLQLQARLKDEECDIPIIFITAHGDAEMQIQAMRGGAVEFLAKPFDHQLLLKTVRAALDM